MSLLLKNALESPQMQGKTLKIKGVPVKLTFNYILKEVHRILF